MHETKPHDESVYNTLELINEYSLTAFGYTMLMFTGIGFGNLTNEQFEAGRIGALVFVCFLYIVNIGLMMN